MIQRPPSPFLRSGKPNIVKSNFMNIGKFIHLAATPAGKRLLLSALRMQKNHLNTRLRVLTHNANPDTRTNLETDFKTTEQLIATLQ